MTGLKSKRLAIPSQSLLRKAQSTEHSRPLNDCVFILKTLSVCAPADKFGLVYSPTYPGVNHAGVFVHMRLDHWKQATPLDQMQVVLMSVEGHIDNYANGVGDSQLQKAQKFLNEFEVLLNILKENGNQWEPEDDNQG